MTALVPMTPLDELTPQQRTAVEFYTNPMYRATFGNKTQAAWKAGYRGKNAARVFEGEAVGKALVWLEDARRAQSAELSDYLATYAMDAAHALVRQLSLVEDLDPKPMPEGLLDKKPEPIIGTDKDGQEILLGWDDSHLKQAAEITRYNKVAAGLAKEVRQALKIILEYNLGTPQQSVEISRKQAAADPLNLSERSTSELREIIKAVQAVQDQRGSPVVTVTQEADAEPVDADFEVEVEEEKATTGSRQTRERPTAF